MLPLSLTRRPSGPTPDAPRHEVPLDYLAVREAILANLARTPAFTRLDPAARSLIADRAAVGAINYINGQPKVKLPAPGLFGPRSRTFGRRKGSFLETLASSLSFAVPVAMILVAGG